MSIVVADATALADAYLDGVLKNDATLMTEAPAGVLNEQPIQDDKRNVVLYTFKNGTTAAGSGAFGGMQIINNRIIYEVLWYLVRIAGYDNTYADLKAGADRIKQLLHLPEPSDIKIGDTVVGRCLWSEYVAPWKALIPDSNVLMPERGGLYKIAVQPA